MRMSLTALAPIQPCFHCKADIDTRVDEHEIDECAYPPLFTCLACEAEFDQTHEEAVEYGVFEDDFEDDAE